MNGLQKNLIGLAVAVVGGIIANLLHLPLPWLIGALFATALWKMNGLELDCDNRLRQTGQWVIGASLGSYFTPQMFDLLAQLYDGVMIGVSLAISVGVLSAFILYRVLKIDFATAWFSSMVGGASEMATMAERYQAKVDFVASAHTVRVILVVTIIPFSFYYLGLHGTAQDNLHTHIDFSWWGFLRLIAISGVLAMILQRLKVPVAWILAPLIVTLVLVYHEIYWTSLPVVVKQIGQVLIGWSLGNKFSVGFFSRSPKFLMMVAVLNIVNMLLTVLLAYFLSWYMSIDITTLILSVSAGGIAEMTITAESLHLGVAIVTVFHVIRMATVAISSQPLYLLARRFLR